ncbi:hypothetical protein BDP27DRAFT_1309964 [Rhodocollybia butyracea]|uniref:Uncharacterized protein n=1 Tax=Rhodocollybia butyracea TaxID=206335 RepID=A0A9P5Q563_9AGAR|nr:hypothetical protein BDP27DRAFT_1309964 [Rhodocollybia butyracea]
MLPMLFPMTANFFPKHDRDDSSEIGIYAHMKSFIPIISDESRPPTPTQFPSAPRTTLPYSLASSMSSPVSSPKSKRLSLPSRKRVMKWEVPEIPPASSSDRSTGTWTSRGTTFEPVRAHWTSDINPQASFVDFRETEQRILHFERGTQRVEGWGRRLQRRIRNALQKLRSLWT